MLKTLERECFCGSRKGEVLHTQHFVHYEEHLLPRSYDVVSCLNCGFIFADTPAPQSVYDEYYKNFSKYEEPYLDKQLHFKRLNAERVSRLAEGNTEAKILDIGCGAGGKLLILKELGFTNLYGLDPSAACVENLKKNGITGIHGSIFANNTEERFDIITLDEVLEHIVDLNRIMQKTTVLLNKGGFVNLTVPDACRYSEIQSRIPFLAFNSEHINHFDFNSLANLGLRHGLCVYDFENKIAGLYELSCTYRKPNIENLNAKASIITHIEKSAEYISSITLPENEKIIIWGVGSYLSRLISTNIFENCSIIGFVDNDRHKTGKTYMNNKIFAPDFLHSISDEVTIVICAENYSYAGAIREQILRMGVKNKIISL